MRCFYPENHMQAVRLIFFQNWFIMLYNNLLQNNLDDNKKNNEVVIKLKNI